MRLKGSGFASGAVEELTEAATGVVQPAGLMRSRTSTDIVVQLFMLNATPGVYQVRVKNPDGSRSNPVDLLLSGPSEGCVATVATDRWKGEYFGNTGLTGSPLMIRDDGAAGLNFDWFKGNPNSACGLKTDYFSVRWTRSVSFAAGTYRFTVKGDDGVRLKIDGRIVIDEWRDQAARTYTADVPLTAGTHTVVFEYYEKAGAALAALSWEQAGS
jgi:hypothetical protein